MREPTRPSSSFFFLAPWLVLVVLLSACAPTLPRSYVMLVPDASGSVGQVVVSGAKGQQVLTQAGQVAGLDGSEVKARPDQAQIDATFGAAQAAQPKLPEHFVLYFLLASTQLTAESEAALQDIVNKLRTQPQQAAIEVVIIGHTDTVGSDEDNVALSGRRARLVAERLQAAGLQAARLTLEAHGEKNLLVPTKDETPEPRNRRVQVTIR